MNFCFPDDFSSDEDYAMFFEALGSGSKEELQSEESTDVSIFL